MTRAKRCIYSAHTSQTEAHIENISSDIREPSIEPHHTISVLLASFERSSSLLLEYMTKSDSWSRQKRKLRLEEI